MTGYDLLELRNKLGLTQKDMASHMGLSLRAYVEIEGPDGAPRAVHVMAAERVSLLIAAERGDPMLATAAVRRDALKIAHADKDALQADLAIERLHQKLDAIREQELSRLSEEVRVLTALLQQTNAKRGSL